MLRLRRSTWDTRVEMAPLLDIVFLLLTFFIYAFLLMVRVDFVPMELRAFESGVAATPVPAATISIDLDGALFLDRVRVDPPELVPAIKGRLAEEPRTVLYLAIADGIGNVDRTPRLLEVWDELQSAGINVNLVGKPPAKAAPAAPSPAPIVGETAPSGAGSR